jgi:hypothetical protein
VAIVWPSTYLPALLHCRNAGITGKLALPAFRTEEE